MIIGYESKDEVFYQFLDKFETEKVKNLIQHTKIKCTFDKEYLYYRVSRETFHIIKYLLQNEIEF